MINNLEWIFATSSLSLCFLAFICDKLNVVPTEFDVHRLLAANTILVRLKYSYHQFILSLAVIYLHAGSNLAKVKMCFHFRGFVVRLLSFASHFRSNSSFYLIFPLSRKYLRLFSSSCVVLSGIFQASTSTEFRWKTFRFWWTFSAQHFLFGVWFQEEESALHRMQKIHFISRLLLFSIITLRPASCLMHLTTKIFSWFCLRSLCLRLSHWFTRELIRFVLFEAKRRNGRRSNGNAANNKRSQ